MRCKGISLEVHEGEIVTLLGANGAGQVDDAALDQRAEPPASGPYSRSTATTSLGAAHEIVSRGIAQSPEGRRLFPRMTVTENLEMGAFQRHDKPETGRTWSAFRVVPAAAGAAQPEGRDAVGRRAADVRDREGTRWRGRSCCCSMSRHSVSHRSSSSGSLRSSRQINEQGTSILLVEQNALMALDHAHRGYVLETGRIVLHD